MNKRRQFIETKKNIISSIKNDLYNNALSNIPPRIEEYINLVGQDEYITLEMARYEAAMNNNKKAISILENLILSNPKNIGYVIYELGKLYTKISEYDKAIEILKTIDETNHESKEFVYKSLGIILEKNGKYDEALFYFNKIILLQSGNVEVAKYHMAKILLMQDKVDEAYEMVNSVIINGDTSLKCAVLLLKARIFKQQGNNALYEESIDEILLKYDCNNIPALYEKLGILLKYNRIEESKELFKKIENSKVYDDGYLILRGMYYEKVGEYQEAFDIYNHIANNYLDLNKAYINAKKGLLRLYIKTNNLSKCKEEIIEIMNTKIYDNELYLKVCAFLIYIGEYDEAFMYYKLINQEILCENYENEYKRLGIVFSKIYDLEYNVNIESYGINQIIDYDKCAAIKHIIDRHTNINPKKKYDGIFSEDIDIEKFYDEIQDKLILENLVEISSALKYKIAYPNVGVSNGNSLDYVVVVCSILDNQILTAYPVNQYLERSIEEKEQPKQKVIKRKSQIEKFNERYKINES